MDVFITVDVEIWCDDWKYIDSQFPIAMRRYIHGETPRGNYGLPFQLDVLDDHSLNAVLFVEPLFASHFGIEPLQKIIGLIAERGQEVQLHLHPEWVDEAKTPLPVNSDIKRPHMRQFSLDEQTVLIELGKQLIEQAGGDTPNAFRAGNFGLNRDTLTALSRNDITFDSSYNGSYFGTESGLSPDQLLTEPCLFDGVYEYPMTVFKDGTGRLRHAQLTACSSTEMESLLWEALEHGRNAFVILSHGFELLNTTQTRPDWTVIKRFKRLCEFLEKNSDCFNVRGFRDLDGHSQPNHPSPLNSSLIHTGMRVIEQLMRRRFA